MPQLRRNVLAGLLSGVAVVLVVFAGSASAAGRDRVAGSGMMGEQPGGGGQITIGAESGPLGENPQGAITIEDFPAAGGNPGAFLPGAPPGEQDTYHVVCLSIAGDTAAVVGRSIDRLTPDKTIVVYVTDTGQSGLPDLVYPIVFPEGPPVSVEVLCNPTPAETPLTSGNVVVHDG